MEPRADDAEGSSHPIGWTDVQTWADTQDFLYDAKIRALFSRCPTLHVHDSRASHRLGL